MNICAAYADQSSCSDKLILDHNLLVWEHLHGFWRTLPNFNPNAVLSDPSQDIEGEGWELLFLLHGECNAGKEEKHKNEPVRDEIEDGSLVDLVEGASEIVDHMDADSDAGLEGFDDAPNKVWNYAVDFHWQCWNQCDVQSPPVEPIQSTLARALGIAVKHIAAPVMDRKWPASHGLSRTPTALTSSTHNSNKYSHVDSSLESFSSEQSQFTELAKTMQTIKLARIEIRHKQMELKIEQACKNDQIAAEEWALTYKRDMQKEELIYKKQMQERELVYKEHVLQLEIKLAWLNGGQASVILGAHPVSLVQNTYSSNADSFTFPPLPSTGWDLLEPSGSKP